MITFENSKEKKEVLEICKDFLNAKLDFVCLSEGLVDFEYQVSPDEVHVFTSDSHVDGFTKYDTVEDFINQRDLKFFQYKLLNIEKNYKKVKEILFTRPVLGDINDEIFTCMN